MKTTRAISASELKESIKMAIQYIHSCQTDDGGYFFARISPSSLQDTYFAVETLRILEQKPRREKAIEQFVFSFQNDYEAPNIHALYLASGILMALGKPLKVLQSANQAAFERFKVQRFNRFGNLDLEIVSELKIIFEAVSLFLIFDLPVDEKSVPNSLFSLANKDGGFGYHGYSTLAITYYSIQTLALLGQSPKESQTVLAFLKRKEKEIYFIEDLFYLMMTRSTLGENPSYMEKHQAISFILECQRANGGFTRARSMEIPTLEHTYYAVTLLNLLKAIGIV